MNNQDYEQKKKECWDAFDREHPHSDVITEMAFNFTFDRAYALGKKIGNSDFSDAEGEEMLTVSRKRVLNLLHSYTEELKNEPKGSVNRFSLCARIAQIKELFGSKCLPDNVESSEPKPAEPKFKVGDKVKAHYPYGDEIGHIQEVMLDGTYDIDFGGGCTGHGITEDMLEPYTEQKEEKSEHLHAESVENLQIADEESHLRNLSQETANCDKEFDTILKDGFRNERRLNIAAMIAAGWIAHDGPKNMDPDIMAADSLTITDALIAEAEKGGES